MLFQDSRYFQHYPQDIEYNANDKAYKTVLHREAYMSKVPRTGESQLLKPEDIFFSHYTYRPIAVIISLQISSGVFVPSILTNFIPESGNAAIPRS